MLALTAVSLLRKVAMPWGTMWFVVAAGEASLTVGAEAATSSS